MEVILQQDYPALGYVGDVVKVKRGYARNFLIPRGVALELSSRNAKLLAHKMAGVQAKKAKLKLQAEELALRLREVSLEFSLTAGQAGKAFGAVSGRDIELELNKKGYAFERRQIRLAQPIKNSGTFKVEIKLHSEVIVPLEIKVQVNKPARVGSDKEPKAGGKGRRGKNDQLPEDGQSTDSDATVNEPVDAEGN